MFNGPLATGITFTDTDGNPVNAHGGGIIQVGDTFYLHGEYFLPNDKTFAGFSMYSSKDLATWKNEGIILPQQALGTELAPGRIGERPHIIKCPGTGEFVLYAHSSDAARTSDKEVVYATSSAVTGVKGPYTYQGQLKNSGVSVQPYSMTAFVDGNSAYLVTSDGWIYSLGANCDSWWLLDVTYPVVNGAADAPTMFKAGGTYYWFASYNTGFRANNNFYYTAPAVIGPWTYQGFIAPVVDTNNPISDERTWMSQTTWVQPIVGSKGTVYLYWGDHWYGNQDTTAPGVNNYLATYVFQPLVFGGTTLLPTYKTSWSLDVAAGTWSSP
jgi:hypothetical protein